MNLFNLIKAGLVNPSKIYKAPRVLYNLVFNVNSKSKTTSDLIKIYDGSNEALARILGLKSKLIQLDTDQILSKLSKNEKTKLLNFGKTFDHFDSDKSSKHAYDVVYFEILKDKIRNSLNVLEIGIGTNNIDVLSNMGSRGTPGASLRAFKKLLPNANIYGADVDKRILFQENRINTFFVNQTNLHDLQNLKDELKGISFDILIDDGLHNSWANLNSLEFFLSVVNENGYMIIEDIDITNDKKYYEILSALMTDLSFYWIKCNISHLLLVTKNVDPIFV